MTVLSGVCRAQQVQTLDWASALYVSPQGNDGAAGTRDKPFATIEKALSVLPSSGGGVIALLGGTYKENVSIERAANAKGQAALLTITAAPGAKVLLEGGEPITKWTSYNGEKGMYVVEAPDRESLHSRSGYLDVWENSARVRYRNEFDADGVRAYPGSVCLLDDTHILVHTRDGRDPQADDLWRNHLANGLTIARDNVVIRGLRFENYLGGTAARAITIGSASATNYKGIIITDCAISNCVHGLSITADEPRIVNCDIRDVGQGMVSYGTNMAVESCVIQSATGAFAISDLNQHERDGIRYYSPARGGNVIGCVTAGFWAGLYIKCRTPGPDALPMLIENNIFLDGIRAGSTGPQPKNRYLCNIMGPNQERIDPMKDDLLQAATFEANYFFNGGGTDKGSNRAGENPFLDIVAGDLKIKPGVSLPPCPDIAAEISKATQIKWSSHVASALARSLIAQEPAAPELKFIQPIITATSQQGALISTRLSAPAESTLHYRKAGATAWQTAKGIDNTLSHPAVIVGSAPVERDAQAPEYGVLFSLLDGQLSANADYEYFIEAIVKGAPPLRSEIQKLRTSGGPKVLFVRAGSNPALATGTVEHPFAQLQAAFDRALPGDTIQLEKGVYTAPALLVHGGTASAPITIQGAGETATILDGGKEPPVLLELRNTKNVVIRDLQVRWFGNAGILATDAQNVTVERCFFFNASLHGSEGSNGVGISLNNSPRWTISHCIFTKLEHGVLAVRSPQLKLLHNTAYQNMYDGVNLVLSAQGSEITGNSFTFTGNDSITISETNQEALASLVCDYNNYGALLRANEVRPENDFEPAARYGYIAPGKAMARANIAGKLHRFNRLDNWRKFSGLDAHSIFADPQYVDPLNGDFRLMPGSPNILPNGDILGAASVFGAKPVK